MAFIWLLITAIIFFSFLNYAYCLLRNYISARKIGLYAVFQPYPTWNPLALMTVRLNRPLLKLLPFGLGEWEYLHFLWHDWEFNTKFRLFARYGDVFSEGNSQRVIVYVGNAEAAHQLFHRKNDFEKDISFYVYVRFFGDSVLTTGGSTWRHHRKITSPPFSEKVNNSVWNETLNLTTDLMTQWSFAQDNGPLISPNGTPGILLCPDLKSIARNVLSKAGFGVSIPMVCASAVACPAAKPKVDSTNNSYFNPSFVPPGHTFSYVQAFETLTENVLLAAVVPLRPLLRWGIKSMRDLAKSLDDVGLYLTELLMRERAHPSPETAGTLLATLAQTTELSEEDIIANLFMFSVAGLETVAGTLQYAVLLLALHPEEQEWMAEDIQAALAETRSWQDYEQLFPKLVACLCVINETFRLFPTLRELPKTTGSKPRDLILRGRSYQLPANCTVFCNMTALGYNPEYWGPTPEVFAPKKWDARDPSSGWYDAAGRPIATGVQPGTYLRQPVKGAFVPFADGLRICLGKKFALVQMVAFLAIMFAGKRVRIARKEGESQEEADKRAWGVIQRSEYRLTLMVREEIGICVDDR